MSTTEAESIKDESIDSKRDDIKSEEVCDTPTSSELEALFADRYTSDNAGYKNIENGFEPVVIVHPYHTRPKRVFDHTNNRGGRWRGGGEWRGNNNRGGEHRGQWRGHNNNRGGRGWQGNRRNDGEQTFRGGHRVHYPGQF